MAEYTEKWKKSFEKKYSGALDKIRELEKEYTEMKESNPEEYGLEYMFPDNKTLEFDNPTGLSIYHSKKTDDTKEYVEIGVDGSVSGSFSFKFYDLKELIEFRNSLMEAIDDFDRTEEEVASVDYSSVDDCEDEEDAEMQEWEIKAEQPLTQSWTYTVTARSACEAIKMLEEDPDQDGIVNNDDNEYYDYGTIEYDSI